MLNVEKVNECEVRDVQRSDCISFLCVCSSCAEALRNKMVGNVPFTAAAHLGLLY